jgi:hypothetical protein
MGVARGEGALARTPAADHCSGGAAIRGYHDMRWTIQHRFDDTITNEAFPSNDGW